MLVCHPEQIDWASKWSSYHRNVYQRSTPSRVELDSKHTSSTRSEWPKCTILMSWNMLEPSDQALLFLCRRRTARLESVLATKNATQWPCTIIIQFLVCTKASKLKELQRLFRHWSQAASTGLLIFSKETDENSESSSNHGLFRVIRMRFGRRNALGIFHRAMYVIPTKFNWQLLLAYQDDIVTFWKRDQRYVSDPKHTCRRYLEMRRYNQAHWVQIVLQ